MFMVFAASVFDKRIRFLVRDVSLSILKIYNQSAPYCKSQGPALITNISISILLWKLEWISEHFSKFSTFKNSLEVVVYVLENTNTPTVCRDWDTGVGTDDDHTIKHRKVFIEMVLMMLVRNLFHFIMLFLYF